MQTKLLPATKEAIQLACDLLQAGEVVAIPTETVYGLAANALDKQAVQKIFAAKGRPQDNPLIVHVSDMDMAGSVAVVHEDCKTLANAFWPGPLTMVLPKKERVPNITCAGLSSVGVRMPRHVVAQQIIKQSGLPLAAPSANISGRPSPTNAEDLLQDMNGRIPLILDGGDAEVGVESTVVSLLDETPVLLRPGYITKEQIENVLGKEVQVANAILREMQTNEKAVSPGMKYKHYAPAAELYLVKGNTKNYISYVNSNVKKGAFALCFEEDANGINIPYVTYGYSNDAKSQAQRLFSALRELDKLGAQEAYVHVERQDGVYLSIYNRLLRAAQFRVVSV